MVATVDLSSLLSQVSDLLVRQGAVVGSNANLLIGTPTDPNSFNQTGGKTGDLGWYPLALADGTVVYFPCLARIQILAEGGYPSWLAAGNTGTIQDYLTWLRQPTVDALGPIAPTHGISVGGETTLPAPANVPADKPFWVRVTINGALQRPTAFTSDGSSTLTLAGPLDPQVEWIVEQLQRTPA